MCDNDHSIGQRYRAAKILVHLIGDDVEKDWKKSKISQNHVIDQILILLDAWQIETKLSTNYSSLKPFFQLLTSNSIVHHYFALWTLANLTTTDGIIFFFIIEKRAQI